MLGLGISHEEWVEVLIVLVLIVLIDNEGRMSSLRYVHACLQCYQLFLKHLTEDMKHIVLTSSLKHQSFTPSITVWHSSGPSVLICLVDHTLST